MRFSIQLPTCTEGLVNPIPFAQPEDFVRLAQAAERLGYHAVWGNDHVTAAPYVRTKWSEPPNFYEVLITLAVVGALTGEFIGSDKGLGYVLLQASGNLNTTLLFATLVLLSALAMLFFYAVEALERVAIPWHVSQRAHPA